MAPLPRRPTKKQSLEVSGPDRDEIARRAFDLFVARGSTHGRDLDDWFEAESQLLTERGLRRPNRED